MSNLKEAQARLDAKQAEMRVVVKQLEHDGNDDDAALTAKTMDALTGCGAEIDDLKGSAKSVRVAKWIQDKNAELNDLTDVRDTFQAAKDAVDDFQLREKTAKRPAQHAASNGKAKSFGEMITDHQTFKDWTKGGGSASLTLDMGLADIKALASKTLFETTAGWAPESLRTGQFVDAVTRPLQVTDIIPSGRTSMAQVVYMLETTRTHAAIEVAEGDAVAESTFVVTQQTVTVEMIGDSVQVTEIQLEDVPQVQSYLDGRLNFGVVQRLDEQVIKGDGATPNIEGILNVSGIQTQARGADPVIDAYFKANTKLRVTGRAPATHQLFHPNDWEPVRLLRTTDGVYIWGNPTDAGPDRLWGLPVVQSESLTEGTGLVGSFNAAWIQLVERRGVVVEMGTVGSQFVQYKKTIRASGRWVLVVFRPAAFATVTGI